MEIRYQVFVSSTYEDLKEERKEVTQAILECNCFPAGMELFPASNKTQWEVIKKVIDESDFYLVIIAGKYGSMGTDDDGNKISYTEMEFDYALKTNKPILVLLYEDIDNLPKGKTENSQIGQKRLSKFRDKACCGRVIKKWNNKDNLKSAAVSAIVELKSDTEATGWIRANSKIDKLAYDIIEEQRRVYEVEISKKDDIISIQRRQMNEKNREISKSNQKIIIQDEEIKKITENNWDLAIRLRNKENFWAILTKITSQGEYSYNSEKFVSFLWEKYSFCVSEEEEFFLHHISDNGIWEEIAKAVSSSWGEYTEMAEDKKIEYLNSISTDLEEYFSWDYYAASTREYIKLLSVCFFLIFLEEDKSNNTLHTIIEDKKTKIINMCNTVLVEIWETELALCENDD